MTKISINIMLGLLKTIRKHAIGLVSGASLPNLTHYQVNPTEHLELKRQVILSCPALKLSITHLLIGQWWKPSWWDCI